MVEIGGTTAGTILAASPTGWAATAASVATGGNYILNSYTSPATWTKPTGLKAIKVTVQAGGGNGSPVPAASPIPAGGGGGGGGASIRYIPAPSLPGPVAVTVGAIGSTSSFSTFLTATGGATASGSAGASGGVGTLGNINFSGSIGGSGIPSAQGNSGAGGSSLLGIGGVSRLASGTGNNGTNFGAGGSGAISSGAVSGGAGTAGIVIVEEYY